MALWLCLAFANSGDGIPIFLVRVLQCNAYNVMGICLQWLHVVCMHSFMQARPTMPTILLVSSNTTFAIDRVIHPQCVRKPTGSIWKVVHLSESRGSGSTSLLSHTVQHTTATWNTSLLIYWICKYSHEYSKMLYKVGMHTKMNALKVVWFWRPWSVHSLNSHITIMLILAYISGDQRGERIYCIYTSYRNTTQSELDCTNHAS